MTHPDQTTPKKVLITGGSAGLGAALARRFLALGHIVFICGRGEADLASAVQRSPKLQAIRADVSNSNDRRRLMDEIGARVHTLDILVNNAAIVECHDYTDPYTLKEDRAQQELAINLVAPIEMTRLFLLQRLTAQENNPGAIVNIGSPASLIPLQSLPLYSTSKAGLHMFTLTLRRQLAGTLMKVIEVYPPGLDTRFAAKVAVPSMADNGAEVIDAVASKTVAGILTGEETILPHPQSAALYNAVPPTPAALVDRVNGGVGRPATWNQS